MEVWFKVRFADGQTVILKQELEDAVILNVGRYM